MAERRMFAKTIVLSDDFLDMPLSARCLYFTLGMFADDEGFVNSPKGIMRQCGASQDDLKLLIAKNFVLVFESGVIVITDWRINNYLRNDRFQPTKYIKERNMLTTDERGSYQLLSEEDIAVREQQKITKHDDGIPNSGIPNSGIPSIGKDSIGKDSIGKVNNKYTCAFEDFWKAYPRRKEKGNAYRCYQARLNDGWSNAEMLEAAKAYAEDCKKNKTAETYIKLPATFLSSTTPFTDFLRKEGDDGKERDSGSDGTTGKILTDEEKRELIARLEADDTELNFEDLL